jgi:hypothetical protein
VARESAYYDADGNATHSNANPSHLRTSASFPDARALISVNRPVLYLGGRIEAVQQSAVEVAVRALVTAGSLHLEEELEHLGEETFHEALRLARSAGLQVEEAQALHHLGCAQLAVNRPKAAQAVLEQAVVLARQCRLPRFEARALQQASVAAQLLGEIALGLKLRTEAEALHPDGSWRRELGLQITWYVSMYQDGGQNACHAAAAAVRAVHVDKASTVSGTMTDDGSNRISNADTVAPAREPSGVQYLDSESEGEGGGSLRGGLGAMWQAAKGKMMGAGGGSGGSSSRSDDGGDIEDSIRCYLFAGSEAAQLLADGTDESTRRRMRSSSEAYLGSSTRLRKAKIGGYTVGPSDGSGGGSGGGGGGWDNTFVVSVAVATAVYRIGCDEHCTNAWLLSEVIRRHRAEEEVQERIQPGCDGGHGGGVYNLMANALSLSIIGLRRESDGLELALDMHVHESLPGILHTPLHRHGGTAAGGKYGVYVDHPYDPHAHCLEAIVTGDVSGPTAAAHITTLAPPGMLREGAGFLRAQRPAEAGPGALKHAAHTDGQLSGLKTHLDGSTHFYGGESGSGSVGGGGSSSVGGWEQDDQRMELQLTSGHYRGHQMVATAVGSALQEKEKEHQQALLELRASEKRRAAQQMRKCVDAKEAELQEQYGREMRSRLQALGEDHAAAMASAERQRRAVVERQQQEHTKQIGVLEARSERQEEERRLMVEEHEEQRRQQIAEMQRLANTASESGSGATRAAEARARAEVEQERLGQESRQLQQQLERQRHELEQQLEMQRREHAEVNEKLHETLHELELWKREHLTEQQQLEHEQQQLQQRQQHESQLQQQEQSWQQQAAERKEVELEAQLEAASAERDEVRKQLENMRREWAAAAEEAMIKQEQERREWTAVAEETTIKQGQDVETVISRERVEADMRLEKAVRQEQATSETRYNETLQEAWDDSRRDMEVALEARDAEHRQALKVEAAQSESAAAAVLQLQEEQHKVEVQLQEDEYEAKMQLQEEQHRVECQLQEEEYTGDVQRMHEEHSVTVHGMQQQLRDLERDHREQMEQLKLRQQQRRERGQESVPSTPTRKDKLLVNGGDDGTVHGSGGCRLLYKISGPSSQSKGSLLPQRGDGQRLRQQHGSAPASPAPFAGVQPPSSPTSSMNLPLSVIASASPSPSHTPYSHTPSPTSTSPNTRANTSPSHFASAARRPVDSLRLRSELQRAERDFEKDREREMGMAVLRERAGEGDTIESLRSEVKLALEEERMRSEHHVDAALDRLSSVELEHQRALQAERARSDGLVATALSTRERQLLSALQEVKKRSRYDLVQALEALETQHFKLLQQPPPRPPQTATQPASSPAVVARPRVMQSTATPTRAPKNNPTMGGSALAVEQDENTRDSVGAGEAANGIGGSGAGVLRMYTGPLDSDVCRGGYDHPYSSPAKLKTGTDNWLMRAEEEADKDAERVAREEEATKKRSENEVARWTARDELARQAAEQQTQRENVLRNATDELAQQQREQVLRNATDELAQQQREQVLRNATDELAQQAAEQKSQQFAMQAAAEKQALERRIAEMEEQAIEKEEAERARWKVEEQAKTLEIERAKTEAEAEGRRLAEQRVADERATRAVEEAERQRQDEKARKAMEEKLHDEKVRLETEQAAAWKAAEDAKKEAEQAKLEAEEEKMISEQISANRAAEEKERQEALEEARREVERVKEEAEKKLQEEREKRGAEEQARQEAEELTRVEKAKREEAEEKSMKGAIEHARKEAEDQRRKEAEEHARKEAEAEAEAKREAEEEARKVAEEQAKKEAELELQQAQQALQQAQQARLEAEEQARIAAEEQANQVAEEQARIAAEELARIAAEELARIEAEEQAKSAAEEQVRKEVEEQAKKEAEEQARKEAELEALASSLAADTGGPPVEVDYMKNQWVPTLDPTSGHTFYMNRRTGETSWKRPAEDEDEEKEDEEKEDEGGKEKEAENEAESETPAETKNTDDDLDVGWQARVDPATGRTFYVNKATGQSSWKKPKRQRVEEKEDNAPPNEEAASEWLEKKDAKTGRTYYVNKKDKKSSWTKPEGFDSKDSKASTTSGSISSKETPSEPSSSLWTEKIDPKTGRTFYTNSETKARQWNKPEELAQVTAEEEAPKEAPKEGAKEAPKDGGDRRMSSVGALFASGNQGASKEAEPGKVEPSARGQRRKSVSIGGGWSTKLDASTGKYYYFNRKTGETQWKKPPGLEGLDAAAASGASSPASDSTSSGGGRVAGLGAGNSAGADANRPVGGSKLAAAAQVARRASLTRGAGQPQPRAVTSQWFEREDPASGRTFWFNKTTGETQWKNPNQTT